MKDIKVLAFLLLVTLVFTSCTAPLAPVTEAEKSAISLENKKSFDAALTLHLDAVSAKDLVALEKTLAPTGEMMLVLPQSEVLTKASEFLEFHGEWFKGEDWTFETKIISSDVSSDMGFALVESMYREPERDGKPYYNKMAITYTQKKIDGKWYVVKDHACSLEKSTDK